MTQLHEPEFLKSLAGMFELPGEIQSCTPFGNGHINDTYRVVCGNDENGFILQHINRHVFHEPQQVMENVSSVTDWIREKVKAAGGDTGREVLSLIPAGDGGKYVTDASGEYWRMYRFIPDAVCYERPETEEIFRQSAVAFGRFQRQLADYPVRKLYETIPDFHNTPVRYRDFCRAVRQDTAGRLASVRDEVSFLMEREELSHRLTDASEKGLLPLRVTHNDTKLNNVMMDRATGKALCVLDLDTVMPGLSVTDFGDAIRFGASTAAEDEPDLDKVHFDLHLYEIYVGGYIEGMGGALTKDEREYLPDGALVITYEQALRFLGDYLEGDRYYKVAHPEHNLDRARTQIRLIGEMEKQLDLMRKYGA